LSEDNLNGINGTAFWSHEKLGDTFNYDNIDKFNNVLINDSNDISKWDLKSIIGHKKIDCYHILVIIFTVNILTNL
jgi:hypothetical protein